MLNLNLHKARRFQNSKAKPHGANIFQEIVDMANSNSQQIRHNGVAQNEGEAKQHPGQVWGTKVE